MNLTLVRTVNNEDGILGNLEDEAGNSIAVTLEHAYDLGTGDGSYSPKLPDGVYLCVRGQHQLHGMSSPFSTFEVTKVPGHTGILFHVGNYNRDSDGCILLGESIEVDHGNHMITDSRDAFAKFLALQEGIDQFTLTVKDN